MSEQDQPHPSAPQPPAPTGSPVPVPPPSQPQPATYAPDPYSPYGYTGQPNAYGAGQQPPQPPYPGAQPFYPGAPQPPYPPAPQQPKKKVWPWVLAGCLLLFVLGLGGCVGCASCAMYLDDSYNGSFDSRYSEDYSNSSNDYNAASSVFTLDEIRQAGGNLANTIEDGRCSAGVYEVGAGKDIEPGRYFFEGGTTAEDNFAVFEREGSSDSYTLDVNVVYFGNYFADLEEGDVVTFLPGNEDALMYPVSRADFKPAAPYECGLLRVGTDIPAGTYTVTVDETAAAHASADCAAYVMKDLDFDKDSITQTKYVIAGGSQTVTVQDGDWLELYGSVAAPAA